MEHDLVLLMPHGDKSSNIHNVLTYYGINVTQTEDVESVKAGLMSHSPAFILLDFNTKGADSLLHELARGFFRPYPFIIVSSVFANGTERAAMLSLGADACIDHPINSDEVLSVIKAVQRRERRIAGLNLGRLLPCIEYKGLEIDPSCRTVVKAGEQILLTAREFDILHVLAYYEGTVLSKEEIYKSVWGGDYQFALSNVARNVSSLRQKIGLDIDGKDYVQTVFGVGYRFGSVDYKQLKGNCYTNYVESRQIMCTISRDP